jgi:hypothetical protein
MTEKKTINRRYPGVQPFKTEQANLFFGRGEDRDRLLNLILLEKLMVLFGKSGYGKSSLLNAGLIPDLEAENKQRKVNYIPISVRFTSWGGASDDSLVNKFLLQLRKAVPEIEPDARFLQHTEGIHQTLWVECKLRQTQLKPRFVLLFDQFEEFFTYPMGQQNEFKIQLAELLYADLPAAIWQVKANWTEEQEDFLSQPMDVRAVLAIRADRMSYLDGLKDKLPAILQKRYELKGLKKGQATDAIIIPASLPKSDGFETEPFDFTEDAIDKIITELQKNQSKQLNFEKTSEQFIESFLLQTCCIKIESMIEDRRSAAYGEIKTVKASDLPNFDRLYEEYYENQLNQIDPSVRSIAQRLIEDKLIFENEKTGESRRLSVDSDILLAEEGITQTLLHQLESTFLLRRESTSTGGFNYEVSHDTMIAPILKSKAAHKALEKVEAERREARRKQLRLLAILAAVVLALAVVIGVVVYVLKLRNDAVEAKDKALIAEKEAILAKNKAEEALKKLLITEIDKLSKRVEQVTSSDNACPDDEMMQSLRKIRDTYPSDEDVKRIINQINIKLESKKCPTI